LIWVKLIWVKAAPARSGRMEITPGERNEQGPAAMAIPIEITFRNMESSVAIEAQLRERAEALERFFPGIIACRAVVELAHRHHRQGKLFHIRIRVAVPGREIVVDRGPAEHHAHEDVAVAIRDAFDAARRQLEDHHRHLQGQVKAHEPPTHGRIVRLIAEGDYGFIESATGEEIYMHRDSVVGGRFEDLRVGDEVRYVAHPGEGEKGPQASTVIPIGKHHLSPSRP
jgi:cold shock CspA family protein/ribosome-associated translation inhibitor RaiA